jgi:hypothetical protein
VACPLAAHGNGGAGRKLSTTLNHLQLSAMCRRLLRDQDRNACASIAIDSALPMVRWPVHILASHRNALVMHFSRHWRSLLRLSGSCR